MQEKKKKKTTLRFITPELKIHPKIRNKRTMVGTKHMYVQLCITYVQNSGNLYLTKMSLDNVKSLSKCSKMMKTGFDRVKDAMKGPIGHENLNIIPVRAIYVLPYRRLGIWIVLNF